MPTPEQRNEALKKASTQIAALAAIDSKLLARTTDVSPSINFKDAVPYFTEMLDLCKQLAQRDLSRLTHQQLTYISNACTPSGKLHQASA